MGASDIVSARNAASISAAISTASGGDDTWFCDPANGYALSYQQQSALPPTSSFPAQPMSSVTPESSQLLKKPRKQAATDGLEKRGAIFKKKCPQNILERVDRVMEQRSVILFFIVFFLQLLIFARRRFFLLSRERTEGQLKEEFTVTGSTGNVRGFRCFCYPALIIFPFMAPGVHRNNLSETQLLL
jgi:hypothetical protein